MKINRILLVCLAVALLIFTGFYGCAKKQVKETGGLETQKPMEKAPPEAAPEKAPPPPKCRPKRLLPDLRNSRLR